jgi:hypothetical protein
MVLLQSHWAIIIDGKGPMIFLFHFFFKKLKLVGFLFFLIIIYGTNGQNPLQIMN